MRGFSTSTHYFERIKTGIVFLNMGGPQTLDEVQHFLLRLFSDREILYLPFQKHLAQLIASKRSSRLINQYSKIGGGSPITYWTKIQGENMVKILNQISPETAPHKFYIGFRYSPPLVESTINEIESDKVERAVAFSQYPQYSCTTSGSSFNAIARHYLNFNKIKSDEQKLDKPGPVWSFIDRWPAYPSLTLAFANKIRAELNEIPDPDERQRTILLFSAHSIPMTVVNRGDPYPQEVAATVHAVMENLNFEWPYRLVWQSKVGPISWLGPSTKEALHGLARLGYRHALLVPIAFTSDHIETLYEMDVEYCSEVALKAGLHSVRRAKALNDDSIFTKGLADLVANHLRAGKTCTKQFMLRCPMCTNHSCESTRDFISAQTEKVEKWTKFQFPSEN